jgi:DNA ligase-1
MWQGFVAILDGEQVIHYTVSYQETASGGLSKKNRSEPTTVVGKNIGRANETTPTEQAISEITAIMAKKIDSGYHEAGVASTVLPLPMLAHKFKDRGKSIIFPCYLQPKLDGHRALTDGTRFWTRQGKLYNPEVVKHLQFDTQGMLLDGEMMLPKGYDFQTTCSAIKKVNENTPKLGYYVFDLAMVDNTFDERLEALKNLFHDEHPDQVYFVSTMICETEDEVSGWLSKSLKKGYEGVMLRNPKSLYAFGQRSVDLQKVKEFVDAEYTIIGVTDGKGREDGAIIYICETPDKNTFTVRPEGSVDSRKELFRQWVAGEWTPIGKMLTVRMQELSNSGIPRFPVGVTIRDYED